MAMTAMPSPNGLGDPAGSSGGRRRASLRGSGGQEAGNDDHGHERGGYLERPLDGRRHRARPEDGKRRRGLPATQHIPGSPPGRHRCGEEAKDEEQPEDSELSQRLQIQGVGIQEGQGRLRVCVPIESEVSCADAGDRLARERVQRRLPVLASVAAAGAQQVPAPGTGAGAGRSLVDVRFRIEQPDGNRRGDDQQGHGDPPRDRRQPQLGQATIEPGNGRSRPRGRRAAPRARPRAPGLWRSSWQPRRGTSRGNERTRSGAPRRQHQARSWRRAGPSDAPAQREPVRRPPPPRTLLSRRSGRGPGAGSGIKPTASARKRLLAPCAPNQSSRIA